MQSFLVVGGTNDERLAKAQRMANSPPAGGQIGKFNRIILKRENSIGIDAIRDLKHQLSLKAYSLNSRLVILPKAENLTIPAQNAILKLLEEPPRDTIIILCSPTIETFLPTIVSRCQVMRLPAKSQITIDKKSLNSKFYPPAGGLNSILKAGVGERVKIAGEIAKSRDKAITFCQEQLVIWREKMIKEKKEEKRSEASKTLRLIQKALRMLEANVNPKLTIENLFLNYPKLFSPFPIRDRNMPTIR